MKLQCNWCQAEKDLSMTLGNSVGEDAQYICTSCLIPILPRSLESSGEKEGGLKDEVGKENRRAMRHSLFSEVLLTSDQKKNKVFSALLIETSDQGMKVEAEVPLTKGENLVLGLFGQGQEYKVIGEIIHITVRTEEEGGERYLAGVKLTEICESTPQETSENA